MIENWVTVEGRVEAGYQVASGQAENSPYPQGTIVMQTPFFQSLGLDLTPYFPGTLNVSIAPYQLAVQRPEYTFTAVKWSPEHAPETFSFSKCHLRFRSGEYTGWVYYPHPETKIDHRQSPSIVEILAPPIPHIQYGDRVELQLNPAEITLIHPHLSSTPLC